MKINLQDVLRCKDSAYEFDYTSNIEGLEKLEKEDIIIKMPINFAGTIENIDGIFNVKGRAKIEYETKCSRCLKTLKQSKEILLEEKLTQSKLLENKDIYVITDNLIELDKVLKENVLLSLPVKSICQATCKGLCSKCGCDLNNNSCTCVDDDIDPRLQGLKNYFTNNT